VSPLTLRSPPSIQAPAPTSTIAHKHIPRENLLGITGSGFTILATSRAAVRGATILKASDDKTRLLSPHTLLGFSGEPGDTVQFAEFIEANVRLYSMRNSTELSPAAVANFVRSELASSLRSRNPYTVNLLLAGVDVDAKEAVVRGDGEGSLYWLDYLASLAKVPYAAHGYAQYYCLSILDKHHHPGIELEEGLRILKMCTDELKRRLPIDFKGVSIVRFGWRL
jgi:20S proteasome subunit beta 4